MYDRIDEISNTELYATHGWSHVRNVTNTLANLMTMLNCSEDMIECGKIAALLHDIGCIYGKENHATNSYNIAKEYLKNKDISEEYKNIILDAIIDHSEGKNLNNIINPILTFADKIDYSKSRLTSLGYEIENFNEIQYIDKVNVLLDSNQLIVQFIAKENFNKESLEKYYFTPKIFKAIHNFAKYLNIEAHIKLNNDEWIYNK